MRPQLVMMDPQGKHNADPATIVRLKKNAVWKRQRIVYVIPASDKIATKVYLNHMNLIFPPNNQVVKMAAIGCEVGEAYSAAFENVLSHPEFKTWEYILTIEHDNMPPPDGVLRLVERMEQNPKLDCIGGLYYTKGDLGVPQIWGDPKDPVLNFRPQIADPSGGLVECNGTGMGFNLWRIGMFKDKKLRRPWFKTQTEGGVATQDLYFWTDAKKYGYRCAIDCSVRVGHYDAEGDFVW